MENVSFMVYKKGDPVIDAHLHALTLQDCASVFDPKGRGLGDHSEAECEKGTFRAIEDYNLTAVTSGSKTHEWKKRYPERIIPGLMMLDFSTFPDPAKVKETLHSEGYRVLGEIAPQLSGVGPSDSRLDPLYQVAEDLDIPVCIHIGPGAREKRSYRASLGNPYLLEEALVRHPGLRIWVAHAGWPLLDEMIGMMDFHGDLYVDLGWVCWSLSKKELGYYVGRMVDVGLDDRVMFGSDQMMWPDMIKVGIENIISADWLNDKQVQGILHGNAKRFLRL